MGKIFQKFLIFCEINVFLIQIFPIIQKTTKKSIEFLKDVLRKFLTCNTVVCIILRTILSFERHLFFLLWFRYFINLSIIIENFIFSLSGSKVIREEWIFFNVSKTMQTIGLGQILTIQNMLSIKHSFFFKNSIWMFSNYPEFEKALDQVEVN